MTETVTKMLPTIVGAGLTVRATNAMLGKPTRRRKKGKPKKATAKRKRR